MNATTAHHPLSGPMARRMHINKAKAELKRLTNALTELEQNTSILPHWNWVGDWQDFANRITELTDDAERAVQISCRSQRWPTN